MKHHRSWIASVALFTTFGAVACGGDDGQPAVTTPSEEAGTADGGADARGDGATMDGGNDASSTDGGDGDAASDDAGWDSASADGSDGAPDDASSDAPNDAVASDGATPADAAGDDASDGATPADAAGDDASDDATAADAADGDGSTDGGTPVGWAKVFTGTAYRSVNDVGVDADGNTYAAGWFLGGDTDFGDGKGSRSSSDKSGFVLKLDPDGNVLWATVLSAGSGRAEVTGLSVLSDGRVAFTGTHTSAVTWGATTFPQNGASQAFVAVADADGKPVWGRGIGGAGGEQGKKVSMNAGGTVAVIGSFDKAADFGGGSITPVNKVDNFVAVYDSTGAHKGSRRLGTTDSNAYPYVNGVALRDDGDLFVAGIFAGTSVLGTPPLASSGDSDGYVARLGAADLSAVWATSFGSTGSDRVSDVALAPNGELVVTGTFQDTVDFGGGPRSSADADDIFLVRLDVDGGHVWSESFGTWGAQQGGSVAVGASGDIVMTALLDTPYPTDFGGGPITPASGASQRGVYARFAGDGTHVESFALTSGGDGPYLNGVALASDGDARVGGQFRTSLELYGSHTASQSSSDAFVARRPKP